MSDFAVWWDGAKVFLSLCLHILVFTPGRQLDQKQKTKKARDSVYWKVQWKVKYHTERLCVNLATEAGKELTSLNAGFGKWFHAIR